MLITLSSGHAGVHLIQAALLHLQDYFLLSTMNISANSITFRNAGLMESLLYK